MNLPRFRKPLSAQRWRSSLEQLEERTLLAIGPLADPPAAAPEALLSDLTGNGFVDFEDLTVLLSNWNAPGATPAEGNLVSPAETSVDFEDLTVLLSEWTGPDNDAPQIIGIVPGEGATRFEGHQHVRVSFSEPMNLATLTEANIQLVTSDAPNSPLPVESIQIRNDGAEVELHYDALTLPHGADREEYQIRIDTDALTDRAGIPIGGNPVVSRFQIISDRDPGNDLLTSLNIGVLDDPFRHDGLIGDDDPVDVYKFEIKEPAAVQANLTGRNEGAILHLLADLNGDEVFNTGESFSSTSTGGAGDLRVSEDLLPGTYYVWVQGGGVAQSTPYRLSLTQTPLRFDPPFDPLLDPGETLDTARDLGPLSDPINVTDLVMHHVDPIDVYRFTIDDPAVVQANLTGRNEGAILHLLADLNGDEVFNTGESFSSTSTGGAGDLRVSEDLLPGTYYVWVQGGGVAQSTPYRLSLTQTPLPPFDPPVDPGESLDEAHDLGTLSDPINVNQLVMHHVDPIDVYKFTIDDPAVVQANLTGRNEGAILHLLADSGDVIRSTSTGGAGDLRVSADLLPGMYFVRVQGGGVGQSTPYKLSLTQTPSASPSPGAQFAMAAGTESTSPSSRADAREQLFDRLGHGGRDDRTLLRTFNRSSRRDSQGHRDLSVRRLQAAAIDRAMVDDRRGGVAEDTNDTV